jgi:carboxyl-terminal processing protease
MNKILKFMKSTKGLILLSVLFVGSLFVAFTNNNNADRVLSQKQKLLTTVGELLEKQHYSPQEINDNFSKKIFNKYINDLDGDKCLFIETDINTLKKYETTLDDEIHGKEELQFLPAINLIYNKRTDEIIALYKDVLSKPFDYSVDEDYVVDGDKIQFPKDEATRKDRLRKKLKYMSLERYVDLLEQREKSVVDSIKTKTNAQLEIEARTRVQKAMDKIYSRIKAKFNDDERFNAYVNIITNLMDPHTDFFPPVEKRAFDEMMSGRFFGIGAQLQEQDGNIKIASLMPAYPAQRSGQLDVNDVIVKVAQGNEEPVEITGYDIQDAVKLIRGKRDTEVKLTVKKADGTNKVVSIIRAEIVQDEAYARSAVYNDVNGDKIGYLWLPDFYADFERVNGARCSEDVATEIKKLKAANVKGIVLDLRYNGGGSLYEVVQMVGLFVPKGPVVLVRDKDGKSTPLTSDNRNSNNEVLYDGPLTVMVNEASASASEIFAAAIQDYGRGVIVGSSTYGKGTVQRNVPLSRQTDFMNSPQSDLGFVKLTFQKFYRISGGSTQLKGVTPDVVVPDMLDYLKIREKDNAAALGWDEIKKADYQISKNATTNSITIKKINDEIAANNTFKLIKDNASWLSKHSEEPRTLQLEKYKEYQKNVAATVAQNSSLLKLKQELNMTVLKEDNDKFYNNADKQKGERYQAWLKSIKSDIYISESIDIIKSLFNNKIETATK